MRRFLALDELIFKGWSQLALVVLNIKQPIAEFSYFYMVLVAAYHVMETKKNPSLGVQKWKDMSQLCTKLGFCL
jgi:hypothetical protein